MTKLLYDEHPILVYPNLAAKIGLNESIILQQIHYWLVNISESKDSEYREKHFHEGRYWVYNTYNQWQEQFPFWCVRTIKTTITKLEKAGYLISDNFNLYGYDRTKWYSIDYDAIKNLENTDSAKVAQWKVKELPDGKCKIYPTNTIDYTENTTLTTNIDNIECIPTECPIGHDANAWHWQDDNTYYNYINSVLPRYINNILLTTLDDNSSYNIYYTVIAGFYESYYENVGEYHPWYKEEALRRVIESLNDFFEIIDCDTIFECMRLFFSKGNIRSKHLMVFCQYDMLRFLTAEIECDYKGILLDAK